MCVLPLGLNDSNVKTYPNVIFASNPSSICYHDLLARLINPNKARTNDGSPPDQMAITGSSGVQVNQAFVFPNAALLEAAAVMSNPQLRDKTTSTATPSDQTSQSNPTQPKSNKQNKQQRGEKLRRDIEVKQ